MSARTSTSSRGMPGAISLSSMRRIIPFALALSLIAFACSPDDSAEPTTTAGESTTTTAEPSTTSPPTTASTTSTTTTVPETTTTTVPESTTTTTPGLEGDWAGDPLIVAGFGALGWWDGSDWIMAEDAGTLPVVGGEDYQVARIGLEAVTTAGPQTLVCEPINIIGVEVDNAELLGEWPGPYGVAISAPWELQPHLFESLSDDGSYAGFAAQLLSSRGLDVASPVVKQLFRTDLEGDGVNEVIVVAEDVNPGLLLEEGDYSIAFMRKVVQGEVQTAILGATVVGPEDDQFGAAYTVGAVADLSGDGKMEIVLDSAYFEGLGVGIVEYVNDDLGTVTQLEVGCGS
jgi:hypothetical protein